MKLLALLLGRRLANRESGARKIGAIEGVPAMGLDALASVAYGPEAALMLLMPFGATAPAMLGWLLLPIIVLLGLLCLSYWQTIQVYRERGGAYVVARENLGAPAGMVAAAALMIDYILNVAVGISAGVGALVSVLPRLHPHMLVICLCVLGLLTLLNLRGTPESGRVLAVPTYAFLACFAGLFVLGVLHVILAHGAPRPLRAPAPLAASASGAGAWLLLRAFASGCTAMTGVEAVSNSMSAFRDPKERHGHATLAIIVVALGLMLAFLAWLVPAYRIGAMAQSRPGYRTVLAQLAGAIIGENTFYYAAMAALLAVLVLSANTSFTVFPRLCRNLAQDGYLPESFAIAGRRLEYSIGLLCLAGCAGILLVAFGGITDKLIPLFAIGAFTGFALSQFGMAAHWRSAGREHHSRGGHAMRLTFNALGGIVTTAVLMIMVVTKFREGAWITLFLMAAGYALLHRIRRYYARLRKLEGDGANGSHRHHRTLEPARTRRTGIRHGHDRPGVCLAPRAPDRTRPEGAAGFAAALERQRGGALARSRTKTAATPDRRSALPDPAPTDPRMDCRPAARRRGPAHRGRAAATGETPLAAASVACASRTIAATTPCACQRAPPCDRHGALVAACERCGLARQQVRNASMLAQMQPASRRLGICGWARAAFLRRANVSRVIAKGVKISACTAFIARMHHVHVRGVC
jgi:amino acid transporter